MIGFVTWPPFFVCYKGGHVTKPIILVKICYKLLYVSQGVKNSFGKVTSDIRVFGRTCLLTMLLLIGLALFYTQGVRVIYNVYVYLSYDGDKEHDSSSTSEYVKCSCYSDHACKYTLYTGIH